MSQIVTKKRAIKHDTSDGGFCFVSLSGMQSDFNWFLIEKKWGFLDEALIPLDLQEKMDRA